MKYEVGRLQNFPSLRRKTSGEISGENPNSQQSNCTKCDDTTLSSQIYNCCAKTINAVTSITKSNISQSVKSQKMEKREGGKKNQNKNKTKKYYKNKRNRKNKIKRSYKNKTKNKIKTLIY